MKKLMVALAFVVVFVASLSVSTVIGQEICYADCNGDLTDLVIMKTEYFRDEVCFKTINPE